MELLFFILFVLAIIISSGIVSCSEAALLSISYTKTKELVANSLSENHKKARRAQNLLEVKEHLQKYISTIVIVNNIINIVGSVYVGVLASSVFGSEYLGLVSGILTFLIIMFSEIIPKIIGEQNSESISLKVAGILIVATKFFSPLLFIVNKIVKLFVKVRKENQISEGEIKEMAALGHEEGSLNAYESEVISNVFRADELDVYEIMVPKNKVVLFDIAEDNFESIVKEIEKTGFTRFPVKKDGEIIGIINVKDLFKFHTREEKFSIQKILRPVIFAPEQMKVFSLEKKLKKSRIHMAIIVNEHGDFTGLVTLEDIIEEVLGEIEDEFDKEEEKDIVQITEKKYQIKGTCDLEEINEELGLSLPIEEDFTTLNGFLISKLDSIPRVNQKVKIEEGQFRVISSSKRKVLEVELILH